jgi:[acyl-carrier-protein] S-malonyltransferase
MKKAYIFPGQGSQFSGMGKDLYESNPKAKDLFEKANEILGFRLTDIMFSGTDEELKQTKVTQPAIFTHSAVLALVSDIKPDMVAGHSLGEFSALVANGVLDFESALKLVYQRALAMQEACEANLSTMAAVLGLEDETVEKACALVQGEVVVPANYNCQGQLVISGSHEGINLATEKLKEAGAKRVLPLPVGGAFHSPLMESARQKLATAIENTHFNTPTCPIYQNVNAQPANDVATIKANLIAQLTGAVRWTQCVQNMVQDGATTFIEVGAGKVLQGLV